MLATPRPGRDLSRTFGWRVECPRRLRAWLIRTWPIAVLRTRVAILVSLCIAPPVYGQLTVDWRVPALGLESARPAIADGRVFFAGDLLVARAVRTGDVLWRAAIDGDVPRCVLATARVVVVAGERLSARSAATGELIWDVALPATAALGCGALTEQFVVVGTRSGDVIGYRHDGTQAWSRSLGAPGSAPPSVVRGITVSADVVFVSMVQLRDEQGRTASGRVVALDLGTGARRWDRAFGTGAERRGAADAPLVQGDVVVVPDAFANRLVALDRASGMVRWEYAGRAGHVGFGATPVADRMRVYAVSGDAAVHAVNIADGSPAWRAVLPASGGVIGWCGDHLLATYQGVAVIDPLDGRVVARGLDEEGDFVASPIAVDAGVAYAAGPRAVYRIQCGKRRSDSGASEGRSNPARAPVRAVER